MSAPRNTAVTKPKTPVSTKKPPVTTTNSVKQGPTNTSNQKSSINDKSDKTPKSDSPGVHRRTQSKEIPKQAFDPGVRVQTTSDFNESDLSIIKMLEGDVHHDHYEEFEEIKLKDEITALKRDLGMKNNLVERLMKENSDLRKELDELLTTVETAKDKINTKLVGCNQRIQELEDEIKTLKTENTQLQQREKDAINKANLKELEDYVGKYYLDAKKGIDEFYSKLNEKIADFMDLPRIPAENLSTVVLNQNQDDSKLEANKKILQRAMTQLPDQEQSRGKNRHGASRPSNGSISHMSVPNKGKALASNLSPSSGKTGRLGALSASNRRRKMVTLYNFDDIVPTDRSDGNFAGIFYTNESVRKSPKGNFTPKEKSSELPKYEF